MASSYVDLITALEALNTSRYGTDVGSATDRYSTDLDAALARYQTDLSAAQGQQATDIQQEQFNTSADIEQEQFDTTTTLGLLEALLNGSSTSSTGSSSTGSSTSNADSGTLTSTTDGSTSQQGYTTAFAEAYADVNDAEAYANSVLGEMGIDPYGTSGSNSLWWSAYGDALSGNTYSGYGGTPTLADEVSSGTTGSTSSLYNDYIEKLLEKLLGTDEEEG